MQIRVQKILRNEFVLCIVTISLLVIFSSCTSRITDSENNNSHAVDPVGKKEYFELASWNIENFPKNDSKTINKVKQIIRDLDVDMYGVQEITDAAAFNTLIDSLPGWKGILSADEYSSGTYQKTGIIFNTDFISISSARNIFENDSYAFPRPPLTAYVQIKDLDGVKFDFNIIVVHLKANSGGDNTSNEDRRKSACDKLEIYIENEINSGSDPDFIVLGDWNDQIDDSIHTEALGVFLKHTQQYLFLTLGLEQESYIKDPYKSLIDHILITEDSFVEYGNGQTEVRYLDSELSSSYLSDISDHRPVVARFRGFKLSLAP